MELIFTALSYDGLALLVAAAFIAGCVQGFAGFGTALIFIPLAAIVVPPVWVIIIMTMFSLFGMLVLLPRAWRDGYRRDMVMLIVGGALTLPVGLYMLTRMEGDIFRWLVCGLSFVMLGLLASGWRYRQRLSAMATFAVGSAGGFLGGIAGLPGPPIILTYMSSLAPIKAIRGTSMVYLFSVDVLVFVVFYISDVLVALPVVIGVFLAVPYALGGMSGTALFNPQKEPIYRRVAYGLIAMSALAGLPIY